MNVHGAYLQIILNTIVNMLSKVSVNPILLNDDLVYVTQLELVSTGVQITDFGIGYVGIADLEFT